MISVNWTSFPVLPQYYLQNIWLALQILFSFIFHFQLLAKETISLIFEQLFVILLLILQLPSGNGTLSIASVTLHILLYFLSPETAFAAFPPADTSTNNYNIQKAILLGY